MPAYLMVFREGPVRDSAEMEEYQRKTRKMASDYGLTPLAVYGSVHPLEGAPPEAVVMLQFPTVEDARAWYNDPVYQDALSHRLKAADFRVMIVEGM